MTNAARPRFVITGWHFLAAITAFFALVVGVDIYFATLAYRSFPGEAVANPYEAGLAFDRTLDDRAREAALGWHAQLDQNPDQSLDLVMRDKAGALLDGLTVSGTLSRPATEQGQRLITFTPERPGIYRLAPANRSGAWDMVVTARDKAGHRFEVSKRLVWP